MNGKLSRYERLEGVCVLGVERSRLSNSLAVVLMEVADANPRTGRRYEVCSEGSVLFLELNLTGPPGASCASCCPFPGQQICSEARQDTRYHDFIYVHSTGKAAVERHSIIEHKTHQSVVTDM